MKKINYILALLAVGALAFACTEKEEVYTPGEDDVEGCYRVSFPQQTVLTAYELDPEDETAATVTIKAKRQVTSGKITVPITIEQVPFDSAFVFTHTDLVFEDGAADATFEVSFPKAAVGVEYICHVMVTDPQYVSMYSADTTYISFKFLKVSWETLATGTFSESIAFGATVPDVKLQHCVTFPERYRLVDPLGFGQDITFTSVGEKQEDKDGEYYVLSLKPQESGYVYGSYGMVYVRDVASWQGDDYYLDGSRYYIADNYVQLFVQWYVSAGSFGYGYDTFVAN